MKKRIRYIMVLMVLSIVGANIFQGYWLYQAYRLNHREMTRQVNMALGAAVSRSELGRVQEVLGSFDSISTVVFHTGSQGLSDSVAHAHTVVMPDSPDEQTIAQSSQDKCIHLVLREHQVKDSLRLYADTLARRISNMLVMNRLYEREINLNDIDSIYHQELLARNIDAEFRLDTMRVPSWREIRPDNPPPIKIGQPVTTRIFALNPLSRLGIQATFPKPAPVIISRMLGTLIGSVVLLIITTWAFVYMLRTILQQKKLSEIKSDFINNMTHELKTPIATVSAAVEALQSFDAIKNPERTRDYLDISRQELNRLSALVEKVLNIAMEDRRELELQREPTNISDTLQSIVQRYSLHNGKDIAISLECQLDNPTALLDKTHFTNAIQNLVDNAIKYSYDSVKIHIVCTDEDGWLRVAVRDNGIGIPKAYQQSIFEQFFRVPQGDLHNVKGFGLGLAYVKKIVEKHGGRISVRSEPRHGSEFVIAIPQA